MSIYKLYTQNGHSAGFYVQHRSWRNTCALVLSIAGRRSGVLPGGPPLHDSATVELQGFDVRSGRPMKLGESLAPPHDRNYARIAEPAWSRDVRARAMLEPA